MYTPGELDQRVTFERLSRTPDGQGGNTDAWAAIATVWAHARPRSGKENTQFERVNGEASYLFVVRYRSDLKDADRVVWGGVAYNIRLINERGTRRLYLEIDAERGVAQ